MRLVIALHRWLGVALCLLFAVWFASGIVMHFVPFPHLTETERFAGLPAIDLTRVNYGPADALRASGLEPGSRIRLVGRADEPVYLVSDERRARALHATDLSGAAVANETSAVAIAADHARRRGFPEAAPTEAVPIDTDQWSMQGELNAHHPLYRVALNDESGTELYVPAPTGEVVQQTTRRERLWNYVGSVPHWLYLTALRSHPAIWIGVVWWLSLAAILATVAGGIVGVAGLRGGPGRYQGWKALHHWLGLSFGLFALSFVFSGWLSLHDGLPFLGTTLSPAEEAAFGGNAPWPTMGHNEIFDLSPRAREVEWFAFNSRAYRRERLAAGEQTLAPADAGAASQKRSFLSRAEVDLAAARLGRECDAADEVRPDDAYAPGTGTAGAPVYRVVCGTVWYDVDGANGRLLNRLDSAGRAYRWLYLGLHKLDIPPLTKRPPLRTALLVGLCICGLALSLSGVVLAWRRLAFRAFAASR